MASTNTEAIKLTIVETALAGARNFTTGIAVLSSGTIELDTGLGRVDAFFATVVSGTDTESVCFTVKEDLPFTGGAITVDGTLLNEGAPVANAGSEQFCWIALGNPNS